MKTRNRISPFLILAAVLLLAGLVLLLVNLLRKEPVDPTRGQVYIYSNT